MDQGSILLLHAVKAIFLKKGAKNSELHEICRKLAHALT